MPAPDRHLDRDLDRGGTGIGEEHMLEPLWGDGEQFLREALRRLVREPGEDHLIKLRRLLGSRGEPRCAEHIALKVRREKRRDVVRGGCRGRNGPEVGRGRYGAGPSGDRCRG